MSILGIQTWQLNLLLIIIQLEKKGYPKRSACLLPLTKSSPRGNQVRASGEYSCPFVAGWPSTQAERHRSRALRPRQQPKSLSKCSSFYLLLYQDLAKGKAKRPVWVARINPWNCFHLHITEKLQIPFEIWDWIWELFQFLIAEVIRG